MNEQGFGDTGRPGRQVVDVSVCVILIQWARVQRADQSVRGTKKKK